MEDPKVGGMYFALAKEWLTRLGKRASQGMILRSGVLTIIVVALLLVGLALGWREHTKGRFAQLKAGLRHSSKPSGPVVPQPGGQDAAILERLPIEGGTAPEFLSATVLPGRGMNVLQITAFLPKKGKVNLLVSPPLDEAAKKMNGVGEDANGAASLAIGGAIEAPWAGDLIGTFSEDSLNTSWRGTPLHLPGERRDGVAVATGGLLLARASTSAKTNIMPDGGEADATYDAGDFDGRWPSRMQIRSTIQLSSHAIEMKVVASNTGSDPQPVGIGWRPKFAILNGNRGEMKLRLPSVTREEIHSGIPSGHLLSVDGSKYDFSSHEGAALKDLSLNDTFVHLHQAALDSGPVVELHDPTDDYGLRIIMLSSSIKAVGVESPADSNYVLIEPRFNYDDPFGREWSKEEDTGMAVLQPGQSISWSIRLELFALSQKYP